MNKLLGQPKKDESKHNVEGSAQCTYHPKVHVTSEIPTLNNHNVSSRKAMSSVIYDFPSGKKASYKEVLSDWLNPNQSGSHSCIAIVGQAQIGKTRILKNFLNDLKTEERYQYIFYVSLDELDSSDKLNVLQFLTNQNPALHWIFNLNDSNNSNQSACNSFKTFQRVISKLHDEENSTVCIIFDHLEKSNFNYVEDKYGSKNPFGNERAEFFFSYILNRGFGNGRCIILSSPWQYYQLKRQLKQEKIIYVHGINQEDQKKIFHFQKRNLICNCSRKKCECSDTFWLRTITENHDGKQCPICISCSNNSCYDDLQSLFYVPCNCSSFLNYVQDPTYKPLSIVGVAAFVFQIQCKKIGMFDNSNSDKTSIVDFERIGSFAWKQYATKNFVFDEKNLKDSQLSNAELNYFFCYKRKHRYHESDPVFFFTHVLLQEFLAALWLLSREAQDFEAEVKSNKKSFLDGSFKIIHKFMSEIIFNNVLDSCRNYSIRIKEKFDFLEKMLKE